MIRIRFFGLGEIFQRFFGRTVLGRSSRPASTAPPCSLASHDLLAQLLAHRRLLLDGAPGLRTRTGAMCSGPLDTMGTAARMAANVNRTTKTIMQQCPIWAPSCDVAGVELTILPCAHAQHQNTFHTESHLLRLVAPPGP